MSKENEDTPSVKTEKSGIRVAQIIAAALAAVTAALLGSTLGVAGTVLGAGVASVVTTVGGEVYLRSLQRTREAALRAKLVAARALTVPGGARLSRMPQQPVNLADQPTVQLPKPGDEAPPEDPSKLRKLRWPLIIGTSVAVFAVAIGALFLVNTAVSGKPSLPGGGGPAPATAPKDVPSTHESTPSSSQTSSDTTSPSIPTTTPTSPTTSPTSPTTSPTTPTSPKSPSNTPSTTPSAPPADGGPNPT